MIQYFLAAAIWLVIHPNGTHEEYISSTAPDPAKLPAGSKVAPFFGKRTELTNFDVVGGVAVETLKSEPELTPGQRATAEIDAKIMQNAKDVNVSDADFIKLFRLKLLPEDQRVTEWEKLK